MPGATPFFLSVRAGHRCANVPTSSGGSFFVVTAMYPTGESGASNEASADVPAATLTSVKVKPAKVVGKGKRIAHGEALVTDDAGRSVAQGWGVFAVTGTPAA